MKKLFGLIVAVVFSFTLAACNLATDEDLEGSTYLSFDVNPSIEIIVDENDEVISVGLLNEDAEIALGNLDLEGLPAQEAIDRILEGLIETGYINVDSQENVITVTASDEARQDEVKAQVENNLSERGVGAAVFGGEMDEEYLQLAEEYDIGVGRARLISRAVEIDGELTFEEALELDHSEIMSILRDEHRARMDAFIAERREAAEALREEMRGMAEDNVQEHRQRVEDGEIEVPDYDAIRDDVEADLEAIREQYQSRIQERRQQAQQRRDEHQPDETTYQYTTIDINPAIEILLDNGGLVASVAMLNAEAETVLSDLDLIGLTYSEAVEKILEAAIATGFIDVDSNENIVTVSHENADREAALKGIVENALEAKGVGAAVFGGEMLAEYYDLAEEYDISVGRARLISRAVEQDEDLTFEEALELEHNEIMAILRATHQEMMETFIAERREAAQALKDEMVEMAQARVEEHRNRLEDGDIELPDFDAIREDIDVDEVRAAIEARVEDILEEAKDRRDAYLPDNDQTPEDTQPSAY